MATYFVLLGPPGAGKGTQAKIVSEKLHMPHISSGDLFRKHMKEQTGLGKLAATYINKGDLVPDDVTINMIHDRLLRSDCENGALLDGFPRTPAQADALASMLQSIRGKVDAVPYINVPEEELVERLSGRWTCRLAGHTYHDKFNPPRQEGICDEDGSELYQREDDKVDTVSRRIHVYLENTEPLIAYYRQHGLLIEIDGSQLIEAVTDDLLAALAGNK